MSELGFGLLGEHDEADARKVIDSGAPILLLQEHRKYLLEVARTSPYPAARTFFKSGSFETGFSAQKWFEHACDNLPLKEAQEQGLSVWVQGPNEPDLTLAYGRFEAERTVLLASLGHHAIVCNAGVGRPTKENIAKFYEGFNGVMQHHGDLLYAFGVHEYGYLWPWTWLGDEQGEKPFRKYKKLPDIPQPGTEAFLIGRFQHLGIPKHIPIFITECGLDEVTSEKWNLPTRKDGEPFGGWRTCQKYWRDYFEGADEKTFYAELVDWIHRYYSQFEQVKAIYLFGIGPHHDKQFADFDLAGPVLDAILAHRQESPGNPPQDPPQPEPVPPTPEPAPQKPDRAELEARAIMLEGRAAAMQVQADALKVEAKAIRTYLELAKEKASES